MANVLCYFFGNHALLPHVSRNLARAAVGTDSRTGLSPANINTRMDVCSSTESSTLYRPPRWGSDKSWHRRSLRVTPLSINSALEEQKYACFSSTRWLCYFTIKLVVVCATEYVDDLGACCCPVRICMSFALFLAAGARKRDF